MTLFKIPRAVEDQDKLLEMYKAMPQEALKVRPSQAKIKVLPFPLLLLPRVSQIRLSFSVPASPQDGSPYLVSVEAGKTFANRRTQGYTVAVMSTFASKEAFEHYDIQCEAHKKIKAFASSMHQEI